TLALNGGPKAVTNKLKGWPNFDESAIRAVEDVLRSGKVNYWTGKRGMEFEKKFAEWQGSKYAISVATGTAALHVALNSLGIGPGDEVIVPSYTFIATSFSVVQAGAVPRFADVNLEDLGSRSHPPTAPARARGPPLPAPRGPQPATPARAAAGAHARTGAPPARHRAAPSRSCGRTAAARGARAARSPAAGRRACGTRCRARCAARPRGRTLARCRWPCSTRGRSCR